MVEYVMGVVLHRHPVLAVHGELVLDVGPGGLVLVPGHPRGPDGGHALVNYLGLVMCDICGGLDLVTQVGIPVRYLVPVDGVAVG